MSVKQSGSIKNAFGWVLLTGTLCQNIPPLDAAVVLFGLVIADILSRMLVAGFDEAQQGHATGVGWDDMLGHVLFRWVLLLIITLLFAQNSMIGIFLHHQYAFVCVLGLCLNLALMRLACAYRTATKRRGNLLAEMRYTVLAGGIFGLSQIGPLSSDLVLLLAIGIFLSLLATMLVGVWVNNFAGQNYGSASMQLDHTMAVLAPLLVRYADVIILSWLLSPLNILSYLIARGLAQSVSITLNLLSDRISTTLVSAYSARDIQSFVALAARTNLGFLLIGGSASLAALSVGAYVPRLFNLDVAHFQTILFWLVVAEAGPVLFGATGFLLSIAQCRREMMLLSILGALAVWSTAIILGLSDPRQLAQVFAYVQLLTSATSAILLGFRFGIWPGLTAILFRQIKLL